MRLFRKQLWADECLWILDGQQRSAGTYSTAYKQYWMFDPEGVAEEWGRGEVKRGACESYWFEDGDTVRIDENLFFFETKEEAEGFRRTWNRNALNNEEER